jgi:hypothetical protein
MDGLEIQIMHPPRQMFRKALPVLDECLVDQQFGRSIGQLRRPRSSATGSGNRQDEDIVHSGPLDSSALSFATATSGLLRTPRNSQLA